VIGFLDLLTSMTLNDLELPKGVLVIFFALFGCSAHLTLNCDEIAGDRPRQPAYESFSTKRRFQHPVPLGLRRPAQAGVKDGYSLKVVILPLLARVA